MVTEALRKKAGMYGQKGCATYGALLYLNIAWLTPVEGSAPPTADDLAQLLEDGWRSVSLIWAPRAFVVHARPDAPPWLRDAVDRVRDGWVKGDADRLAGLFES